MIHLCHKCDRLLREGDRVKVQVEAEYHILKSSVAFALDKHSLEADSSTLEHVSCFEGD